MDSLKRRLVEYVNEPYDIKANLDLGVEYYKKEQFASSLSHFLRGAEHGADSDGINKTYLVSECLVHAADALNRLGGRHFSTKSTLLHAISNEPKMVQAYLLLSKVYEQTGEWTECNSVCNIGLSQMDNFVPMLYDNKTKSDIVNELLFQKAISEYYIGRCNDARKDLEEIANRPGVQQWIKDACFKSLLSIGNNN